MRNVIRFAIAVTLCALPALAVENVRSITEGTVEKIDATAKTVVVKTADGTEHAYHVVARTSVHGAGATAKASRETLSGLKQGSEIAVHYTKRGGIDTAEEIDRIGTDGLKKTEGTVKRIDRRGKTITIAAADGAEHTYRLTSRAADDTGKDIEQGTEKSAKVTVYYAEEAGDKVAHFFKRAL